MRTAARGMVARSGLVVLGFVALPLTWSAEAQTGQRFSVQGSLLRVQLFESDSLGFETGGELQLRYNRGRFSIGVGATYSPLRVIPRGMVVWDEPRPCDEADTFCQNEGPLRDHFAARCGSGGAVTYFGNWENPSTCSMTAIGVFVEPRLVIDVGHDVFAPYVSARGGVTRFDAELAAGDESRTETSTNLVTGETVVRPVEAPEYTGKGRGSGGILNAGGGVLLSVGRANVDLGATLGLVFHLRGAGPVRGTASQAEVLFRAGFVLGIG